MANRHARLGTAALTCALLVSACVTPVDTNGRTPPVAPAPDASPVASGAAGGPNGTPSTTANPAAVASPSPFAAAALDISPAQVAVGGIVMSLSFEPPRNMVDQAFLTSADPAQQATVEGAPAGASQGSIVLSDMVRVTNNLDPTQAIPADSAQSILRHAMVDVRAKDSNQMIPYLAVSLDLLLDGHPVSFGQAVVPMTSRGADTARLYYGNNVRLLQRGVYQVFVRLNRSPLLGKDQPQAAQFNVVVR